MRSSTQPMKKACCSRQPLSSRLVTQLLAILSIIAISANTMDLFSVKFVELNGSRLIATSNLNYAISSPRLASKNWQTISVNGDQLLAISSTGERLTLTKSSLSASDILLIENLRDEIASGTGAYTHTSTAAGGGPSSSFIMSGTSSTGSMSSSSFSSSTSSGSGGGEMSYNMRDSNNFSISRSDLPFNWSRVFINNDLVTLIFRNGEVQMMPMSSLEPAQLEAVQKLKRDLGDMQRGQTKAMQSSMNMVSSVFNNILGRLPQPPSYQSAVGGMFGNNFPFGPNNSPFDSTSGWPFGGASASSSGGGGASAMAFAGRR